MKNNLGWIIAILGTLLLLFILVQAGSNGQQGNGAPSPIGSAQGDQLRPPINDADHTKGAANGSVTIVEYSDFQCPGCAGLAPVISQAIAEFPNDITFAYRHFPLRSIHANAQMAGQATEAAAMQGKFWDMHDVLFNTQSQWSSLDDPTEFFTELARSIGLDTQQFGADLTSKDAVNAVNDEYNSAIANNLRGTPSLFVNGTYIDTPRSYSELRTLVDGLID
jgi:protein-disulfide isomerase